MFVKSNDAMVKMQALSCLKNLANSLFNKSMLRFLKIKDKNVLSMVKKKVQNVTLQLLDTVYEGSYRKILDGIFAIILRGNGEHFPFFLELTDYWLNSMGQQVNDGNFDLNKPNLMRFKTISDGLKALQFKKNTVNLVANREGFYGLIDKFNYFWRFITEKLLKCFEPPNKPSTSVINFNKMIERCLLFTILLGNNVVNRNDNIISAVKDLMIKTEKMLGILKDDSASLTGNMRSKFESNCIMLTHKFSDILIVSPLIMGEFISNFFEYIMGIFQVKWENEDLQKGVSLFLLKIFKTFLFYTTPEELNSKNLAHKLRIDPQEQSKCYSAFSGFFNNEKVITNIFSYVVSNLMIYDETNIDPEKFIEDQESIGLDTVISDLDCSLPKIGSLIVEQLFYRFPQLSLSTYYNSLYEVVESKSDIPFVIQDNVFSIISYLPQVYSTMNITEKPFDIMKVMQYLAEMGKKNIIFARRFLIVLKSFIFVVNFGDKKQIFNAIIDYLRLEDEVVRFEALDCLSIMINNDENNELDYPYLIELTTPISISMLHDFQTPKLLIKLNTYLMSIFKKSHFNLTSDVVNALRKLDIISIINKQPKQMKPMINDILSILIINLKNSNSFFIYDFGVDFIDICLRSLDNDEADMILNFIGLFLRNIENDGQYAQKIDKVKTQFLVYFNKFYSLQQADIHDLLLVVLEELILMGLKESEFDYYSALETFFKDCPNFQPDEVDLLKSSIFSVYTTLLLMTKENDTFSFNKFEVS